MFTFFAHITGALDHLGLPLEKEKTVGPTKQIVFHGIELDFIAMIACKLHNYSEGVQQLATLSKDTIKDLKSLVEIVEEQCIL